MTWSDKKLLSVFIRVDKSNINRQTLMSTFEKTPLKTLTVRRSPLHKIRLRFFDFLHRNLNSFLHILVPSRHVTGAHAGRSFLATRSLTVRARPAGSRFVGHVVGVSHWFVFHFGGEHLVVSVVKRRRWTPWRRQGSSTFMISNGSFSHVTCKQSRKIGRGCHKQNENTISVHHSSEVFSGCFMLYSKLSPIYDIISDYCHGSA